jgi:hypothetical protein
VGSFFLFFFFFFFFSFFFFWRQKFEISSFSSLQAPGPDGLGGAGGGEGVKEEGLLAPEDETLLLVRPRD